MNYFDPKIENFRILSPKPDGCEVGLPGDCDTPYREMLFNINSDYSALFYAMAFIATIILFLAFLRVFRIWLIGRKKFTLKEWILNLKYVITDGIFNRRIFRRDRYAGIMHFCIMWGIIVEFIGTVLLTFHEREWIISGGYLYGDVYLIYSFILDLFGIILIIGIFMALWRRFISKHERVRSALYDDVWVLFALLIIAVSGLLIEAVRIMATEFPDFEIWSFTGFILARFLELFNLDISALETIHFISWWGHAIAVEILLAFFMFSKMSHIGIAPFNMLLKEYKPFGKLSASLEPIRTVQDLTIGQLASLDSCMKCGRCHEVCPAQASGEPLSPMNVIQDTKDIAHHDYPFIISFFKRSKSINHTVVAGGEKVTEEVLWACTNCMACVDNCPVWISHVDIITGMRSHLIDEGKQVPPTVTTFLESVYKNRNEWDQPKKERMKWSKELVIPEIKKNNAILLWYVGCSSAYDPRNQKVARIFTKILEVVGVEYGTLGKKEICTGDAVRRVGEEALFQELAEKNIKAFSKSGAKRIVTTSPHSYHVIKQEYGEFGFNPNEIEVLHHTQLLYELIQEGKIQFKKEINRTITFHDPCYLGRYNDIIDLPRKILNSIPGIKVVEMERHSRESFCCGGGGGRMFMPSHTETKPSEIRVKEAMKISGIKDIVVGCPWCLSMLEDARKTLGVDDQIDIPELCELVAESMGILD
ncbi:MAG: heterodisulfide reductase-related iron-sulfur binding cluster [Candidatus Hodarchaeales archaeon]|jgi:Fe-S oxidoreductase/nitrate reductase gamma subunit